MLHQLTTVITLVSHVTQQLINRQSRSVLLTETSTDTTAHRSLMSHEPGQGLVALTSELCPVLHLWHHDRDGNRSGRPAPVAGRVDVRWPVRDRPAA